MTRMLKMRWSALPLGCLLLVLTAGQAYAVDPPNWVAALYVEAQQMIGLRWMPAAGATEYKVLRSTTAGSGYTEVASTTAPQHFDKEGLEPGTTYYYVLQAVAGAETSANSEERNVAIPGQKKVKAMEPPEITRLTQQGQMEFGKATYKVGVFWQPPGGTVIAYNVYKSEAAGGAVELLSSTSETQVVDDKVEGGKTYYYTVTALDDQFQETPRSAEKSVTIEEVKAPKKVAKKEEKKELFVQPTRLVTKLGLADEGLPPLNNPTDVEVAPDGSIYVADKVNHMVRHYDKNFTLMHTMGQKGTGKEPGDMLMPNHVQYDAEEDEVLVTVPNLGLVQVFTADGNWLRSLIIEDPEAEKKPYWVNFMKRPDGGYVGVDNKNNNLVFFDDDLKVEQKVSKTLAANGEEGRFAGAEFMDYDSAGNLFVVQGINFSIHKYDTDRENVVTWGTAGDVAGKFLRATGLAVDKNDDVYVTDVATNNITVFNTEGGFIYALGGEKQGDALGLQTTIGIDIDDERGYIYVTEGLKSRVSVLEKVGEVYEVQVKH